MKLITCLSSCRRPRSSLSFIIRTVFVQQTCREASRTVEYSDRTATATKCDQLWVATSKFVRSSQRLSVLLHIINRDIQDASQWRRRATSTRTTTGARAGRQAVAADGGATDRETSRRHFQRNWRRQTTDIARLWPLVFEIQSKSFHDLTVIHRCRLKPLKMYSTSSQLLQWKITA